MTEVPGPSTIALLHDRLKAILAKVDASFSGEFPATVSYRAVAGAPLSQLIDHTLLKQQSTKADFEKLCNEALTWKLWSVCVPSNRVELVSAHLRGSPVKVCTVVGFPFGYASTAAKIRETEAAVAAGADEIDVVQPIGLAKDQDWAAVYRDLKAVVAASAGCLVKVILETSELNLEEKILGALCARHAGAAFLKTSTGFGSGGAQIEDMHLLRQIAGDRLGVKASGGVRTGEFARQLVAAGADRIGTSGASAILGLTTQGGSAGY